MAIHIESPELESQIAEAALKQNCSADSFAEKALSSYMTWLHAEQKAVQDAVVRVEQGDWVDHDELFDQLEKRYSS